MKKVSRNPRNPKQKPVSRAKLLPISEEMKQWSALLASELNSWPDITTKSMFGLLSFYRKGKIFAALPQTRGLTSSSSLIVKFNPMPPALLKRAHADPRMDTNTRVPGSGWFSFELHSDADVRDALWWLNQSYESAKGGP
jgi:luciferase-like monooxygenase